MCITLGILDIDIVPYSTAPIMRQAGNSLMFHGTIRTWMKSKLKRKMTTGRNGIGFKRMGWVVGAGATKTTRMWKGHKEVVYRSGLRLWGGGLQNHNNESSLDIPPSHLSLS